MARDFSAPTRWAEASLLTDPCMALLEYPLTHSLGKSSCSLRKTAFRPLSEFLASSKLYAAPVAAEVSAGSCGKGDLVLRRAQAAKIQTSQRRPWEGPCQRGSRTRSVGHPLCPSLAAVACNPWYRGGRRSRA